MSDTYLAGLRASYDEIAKLYNKWDGDTGKSALFSALLKIEALIKKEFDSDVRVKAMQAFSGD